MLWLFATASAALFLASAPHDARSAASQVPRASLHVRYGDCEADLSFDPTRISEERLRSYLRLIPDSEGSWDHEWHGGGSGKLRGVERLELELAHREAVSTRFEAELRRFPPPSELASLVAWTRARWGAYSWRAQSLLQFCRTRTAEALLRPHGAIDPAASCAREADAAAKSAAESAEADCTKAASAWVRCVNRLMPPGDYPAASWHQFQESRGIKGRKVSCNEN